MNTNVAKQLRLFCFPYAGGNEYIFRNWQLGLPREVEVRAVRLPGRGARIQHAPHRRLSALVDELAEELGSCLDLPVAFFGHSMGAMISFELARAIRHRYGQQPLAVFVSGRRAPHLPRTRPPAHHLADQEFIEVLRQMNGTPFEILQDAELMKLLLPLLRADMEMVETYRYGEDSRLDCPIVGFAGLDDEGTAIADMRPWEMHTSSRCALHTFPGDHFFIRTAEAQVLHTLSCELLQLCRNQCSAATVA